jgi:hypothetical protein
MSNRLCVQAVAVFQHSAQRKTCLLGDTITMHSIVRNRKVWKQRQNAIECWIICQSRGLEGQFAEINAKCQAI